MATMRACVRVRLQLSHFLRSCCRMASRASCCWSSCIERTRSSRGIRIITCRNKVTLSITLRISLHECAYERLSDVHIQICVSLSCAHYDIECRFPLMRCMRTEEARSMSDFVSVGLSAAMHTSDVQRRAPLRTKLPVLHMKPAMYRWSSTRASERASRR